MTSDTVPDTTTSALRAAVDALPQFFALLSPRHDATGRVVELVYGYANPAALEVLHRSAAEVVGHGLVELVPSNVPLGLLDRYARVLTTGVAETIELPWVEDGPVQGSFEVTACPAAGRVALLAQDVTEHRRAQDALARSHQDLQDFAYAVSHDLSAPLRTVHGFAELLRAHLPHELPPEAAEALGFVLSGTERAQRMLAGLLAYSRVQTHGTEAQPVDLAAVVDEVLDVLHELRTSTGATVTHGPLPVVRGDRTQLLQLMQNLLANAMTYCRPGVPPTVEVSAAREAAAWRITVTDDGVGVAEEDRERAFRMFARVGDPEAHPGTGVGLALCRRIVTRHGGTIRLEAAPRGGTSVVLTLADRPAVLAGPGSRGPS